MIVLIMTDSSQELFKKVRSILNKLTPQKFAQLMKQVTELTINTEERLKGVIDLVFEKAIDEPSFSVAYGNMCRCLIAVSRSSCRLKGREAGREVNELSYLISGSLIHRGILVQQ